MNAEVPDVVHHPDRNAFEIDLGSARAVLEYRRSGSSIVFTHTRVPAEFEGRGIGGKLAKAGLEWAREEKAMVVPVCSFVRVYLKRHPEYSGLVESSELPR